ncbi:hypothetical protein SK128_026516, partial [Halocaridina rubra]
MESSLELGFEHSPLAELSVEGRNPDCSTLFCMRFWTLSADSLTRDSNPAQCNHKQHHSQ